MRWLLCPNCLRTVALQLQRKGWPVAEVPEDQVPAHLKVMDLPDDDTFVDLKKFASLYQCKCSSLVEKRGLLLPDI